MRRFDKQKIKARVTRALRNKKQIDLADNEEFVTRTYQHHFVYPTIGPDVIKAMLKGYGKTGFRLIPYPYGNGDHDKIIMCKGSFDVPTITPICESEGFNYMVSMGYHFDFYLGGEYKANLMGHPRFNRTTTSSVTPIYTHELLESMYEHVCNDINIILKEIIDGKAVLITNETNPED